MCTEQRKRERDEADAAQCSRLVWPELRIPSMRWSNGLGDLLHLGDLQLELVSSLCQNHIGKAVRRIAQSFQIEYLVIKGTDFSPNRLGFRMLLCHKFLGTIRMLWPSPASIE